MANELGAGNEKGAEFSTKMSLLNSFVLGLIFSSCILAFPDKLATIFASSISVIEMVSELSGLLAATVLVNCIQPIFSGEDTLLCLLSFTSSPKPEMNEIKFIPIHHFDGIFNFAGVAVGYGWQSLVAYINMGSYYLIGMPLGIILGSVLGFGFKVRAIMSLRKKE